MRVTGCADENSVSDTLAGKLPQRKITTGRRTATVPTAIRSVSLREGSQKCMTEGYVAKRMEVGAVIGAAPKANVVRDLLRETESSWWAEERDATAAAAQPSSSKEHTEESILTCGAEVQKNPPVEKSPETVPQK